MSDSNEKMLQKDTAKNKAEEDKKAKRSHIVTKESLSAVCALFSALALLMLFTGPLIFGQVSTVVTEVLLGTFGYFAYPVFIGVFYLSFTSFFGLKLVKNRAIGLFVALTAIFIGLIVQTAMTAFIWPSQDYLGNCFVAGGSYATSTVCGIVGGLLIWGLSALIAPVGSIIVFSAFTLLCVFVLVRKFMKKGEKAETSEKFSFKGVKWFKKKSNVVEEKEENTAEEIAAADTGVVGQPYVTPRPEVTLPTTDAWARQASYSPFGSSSQSMAQSTSQMMPTPTVEGYRTMSREESRAFLFSGSPADAYQRNLFFDQTARVNNRPAAGQNPTYTQAFEQSFGQVTETQPEKIVSDFTRPAPSYTHPSLAETRNDDGLMRDTSALLGDRDGKEDISVVTPAERITSERKDFVDTSLRLDTSRDILRRETDLEDSSRRGLDESRRGLDSSLLRSTGEDFMSRTEERSVDRGLLDSRLEDEPLDDMLRVDDTQRDTFVSPFSDVDLRDSSEDLMRKTDEEILSSRETVSLRGDSEDRLSSRLSSDRTSRFTPLTPVEEPKKEEAPKPEKPKYIRPYSAPPLHYFDCTEVKPDCSQQEVEWNKEMILKTLEGFGIKEATISSVTYGPTVTRYNIVTPINVSSKKIIGLAEQFAINLHAEHGVNVSFNYGDGATSIEVPNRKRQFVGLGCMLTGAGFVSAKPNSLTFTLGVDVSNEKVYGDVAKMTHILVAGASGMGKSAFLRSLIISLIYKYSPQDLRLILIDPKMADFTLYTGIPHLVINEIICRPQQAVQSLRWAIGEMERRYELFRRKSLAGTYVVGIDGYNANLAAGEEKLPKIVIIVDELADLMSVARKDVEDCIQRLTAKARAAGIHMILATQRPSVDVVTGVIKSNLPTRIACATASETDSRVILDASGAEKLLGIGDMMYSMAGFKNPIRVQAPYIEDAPAQAIINYIRENNDCDFNSEADSYINNASAPTGVGQLSGSGEVDPAYIDALKCAIQAGSASISMLQRKCSVGFNKAGKIIEWMEEMHYIAEFDGSPKPRKTLITKEEFEELYGEF